MGFFLRLLISVSLSLSAAAIVVQVLSLEDEAVPEFSLVDEDGLETTSWGLLITKLSPEVGTVCNDGFTDVTATVICREMGYLEAKSWYTSGAGQDWAIQDNYSIVLDDVTCTESALPFAACSYTTEHNCRHREDVFIHCSDADIAVKEHFYLVDFYGQEVLNSGLLLANGVGSPRVGTICNDGFNDGTATVICREMNYLKAESWHYGNAWAIQYTYPIVLDDVRCVDRDSSFSGCSYVTSHNCGHREDVFLTCTEKVVIFE